MFDKFSIRLRLMVVVFISIVGMVIIGISSLSIMRQEILLSRQRGTQDLVDAAVSSIASLHESASGRRPLHYRGPSQGHGDAAVQPLWR